MTKAKKAEKKAEKKVAKFGDLSQKDAASKRKELIKDLVTARLSLDGSHIQGTGGVVGLKRDLRLLGQKIAHKSKNEAAQ